MRLLDHDLPERNWFNFVLVFVVLSVLGYVAVANYAQYNLIVEIKKQICDENCVKNLVSGNNQPILKMDQLERPIAAMDSQDINIAAPIPSVVKTQPTKAPAKKFESYKNILGGSAASVQWTSINSETFSFDLSLYPENVYVTLEGWIELSEGASRGAVRIYDVTNGRVVDGSEVSVASKERASFYSGVLSIWRGANQYRIEAKSDTGYGVDLNDLRLRIKSM